MQVPPRPPQGGRGEPLISSFMASSSAIMATRPSTSPNNNMNFRSSNAGGGGSGTAGTSGTNNKSVAFDNKLPPTDTRSPVASSSMLPPGRGGGLPQPTTGAPLALRGSGPRLRAEGLMVPPASDAATLRRQVAALQIDLEAHIDGEQRLQSINHELRERLELYMKQNHENVERAESELNTLHEDMEQTLELQRRLAQRAQTLEREKKDMENMMAKAAANYESERAVFQNRISLLGAEVREKTDMEAKVYLLQSELTSAANLKENLEQQLHSITEEAKYLKKRQEAYTDELRKLFLKDEMDRKVQDMAGKSLTRRYFSRLLDAIRAQCIERANHLLAAKHYNTKVMRIGWRTLRMATGRSSLIRKRNARQSQHLIQECWTVWHIFALATHMRKRNLARHARDWTRLILVSWKTRSTIIQANPRKNDLALQHHTNNLLGKVIRLWKKTVQSWRLTEEEEDNLSYTADMHHNMFRKRRVILQWNDWLIYYIQPRKVRLINVQAHINKMIMKQTMAAWKCIIRIQWVTRIKLEEAKSIEKRWIFVRTMARFKDSINNIKIERKKTIDATKFRKLRQGKLIFKNWKFYIQQNQHRHIYRQVAFRHYANCLQRKMFKAWINGIEFNKIEKKAVGEVNQCLMRAAMIFWRENHFHHYIKEKKTNKAFVYKKRKDLKVAKRCLVEWWELMAWKRKANQLDSLMSIRLRRSLLLHTLHNWMYATFDGLLKANAKFQGDLIEAQSQYKDQKYQVSTVDVENLQLIDRLHNMSSELAYLKTTINERTQEINELHRALEDAAILESSMRDEIDQQHTCIEDLQNNNITLQRRIETKNVEDTAGEVHHTLELQSMEQNLQQLHIQLAKQTSQLDSYEKALKETAERLEGASDQSQEKLTSAFEIAGSLRKLLEDREHQYASLEGSSRRRELELEEVQRKLAAANCTLCETVEARDIHIEELENMLFQKQKEVQVAQSQLQDIGIALDAKESHVRKLEYEIKLMSDPYVVKASKFVSNLNSYATSPPPSNHTRGDSSMLQETHFAQKTCLQQQNSSSVPHSPNKNQMPITPSKHQFQPQNPIAIGSALLQTIQVQESLHDKYVQTKQVEQGLSENPNDVYGSRLKSTTFDIQSPRDPSGGSSRVVMQPSERLEQRKGPIQQGTDTSGNGNSQALYFQGQDISQRDWEKSFALGSTTRPTSAIGGSEPIGYGSSELGQDDPSRSDGSMCQISEDQSAVDSLHIEIRRLQARIMRRLQDPPPPTGIQGAQERLPAPNDQRLTSGDPNMSTSRGTSPGV